MVTPLQTWATWYQEVGDPRRHPQVRVRVTGPEHHAALHGMCVAGNAAPNEQNISRAEDLGVYSSLAFVLIPCSSS